MTMTLAADLTPKELADMVGVDLSTVRRWCRSGSIPARRVGGTWRIKPGVLRERHPDLWEEMEERAEVRR